MQFQAVTEFHIAFEVQYVGFDFLRSYLTCWRSVWIKMPGVL